MRIFVYVEDGNVQGISADAPGEVEVILVDMDNIKAAAEDDSIPDKDKDGPFLYPVEDLTSDDEANYKIAKLDREGHEARTPKCGECGSTDILMVDLDDRGRTWEVDVVVSYSDKDNEGFNYHYFIVKDDQRGFNATEGETEIECNKCHAILTGEEVFKGK